MQMPNKDLWEVIAEVVGCALWGFHILLPSMDPGNSIIHEHEGHLGKQIARTILYSTKEDTRFKGHDNTGMGKNFIYE